MKEGLKAKVTLTIDIQEYLDNTNFTIPYTLEAIENHIKDDLGEEFGDVEDMHTSID
tara:strand:- start:286 stop:456 length:171 start_codon:yes stop_codon:yes gene_type:complete